MTAGGSAAIRLTTAVTPTAISTSAGSGATGTLAHSGPPNHAATTPNPCADPAAKGSQQESLDQKQSRERTAGAAPSATSVPISRVARGRAAVAAETVAPPDRTKTTRTNQHAADKSIHADLRLHDLRDGDRATIGQQLRQLRHELSRGVLAASQNLDRADDLASAGQPLDRVQMGEDAAIVHGARRGQDGEDLELLAEQVQLWPVFSPQRCGQVGADDGLVFAEVLDGPLGGERRASGFGPRSARGPLQPTCFW